MWRVVICGIALWLSACAAPAKGTAADAVPTANAAATGVAGTGGAATTSPASGPSAEAPRAVLLWSALARSTAPAALRAAVSPTLVEPEAGPLGNAIATIEGGRRALSELRCGEAMSPLLQASERLLADHLIAEARPLLGDLYSLLLLCADRLNDAGTARRASAALFALRLAVPPDVALVLARHQSPVRYGPPLPPVRIESDPVAAQVSRNLLPIGPAPLLVEGGSSDSSVLTSPAGASSPSLDFIDIELPGYRKIHRPLPGSGELVLALRPEDRPQVLLERAALQEPGSDAQAMLLRGLAALVATSQTPATPRQIVVVWPKEQAGTAVAGEALSARVYDLDKRDWQGGKSDIGAGQPATQGPALTALLRGADGTVPAGVAAALSTGGAAGKAASPAKEAAKKKGLFGNTKWYTWVVAGGVVALIAGLLIAEKVSPEKVTVSATR